MSNNNPKPEDTRTVHDFTSEQIQESISQALNDGNMPLVVSLLHALAVVDPHMADVILEAINLMSGGSRA